MAPPSRAGVVTIRERRPGRGAPLLGSYRTSPTAVTRTRRLERVLGAGHRTPGRPDGPGPGRRAGPAGPHADPGGRGPERPAGSPHLHHHVPDHGSGDHGEIGRAHGTPVTVPTRM